MTEANGDATNGVTAEALGARFVEGLHEDLTLKEWAAMARLNAAETDPLVCRSHDFVDANETMLRAARSLGVLVDLVGEEGMQEETDAIFALFNAAWESAWPALGRKAR